MDITTIAVPPGSKQLNKFRLTTTFNNFSIVSLVEIQFNISHSSKDTEDILIHLLYYVL